MIETIRPLDVVSVEVPQPRKCCDGIEKGLWSGENILHI